jgi:hypothetical protein
MDARNENLFKNGLDAKNFEPSSKLTIGQEGITLYFKRGNYVYKVGRKNIMRRFLTASKA